MTVNMLSLNNNLFIPALGLGTWKSSRNDVGKAVFAAIEAGYRHIDCATIYKNEQEVGTALRKAFNAGLVQRQDLWITSKLWNNAHLPQHVRPAVEKSLKDLGLEYLDLFLIHWPVSFRQDVEHPKQPDQYLPPDEERLLTTWQAMEKLVQKGLIRTIGVSNFKRSRLQHLVNAATIPPAVNQVERHPCLQQNQLLEYCQKEGIVLTAYAPLGSGDRPQAAQDTGKHEILAHPVVATLAEEAGISKAQLLLAWGLAKGTCLIPKTTRPERLAENLAAAELSLPDETLQQLDNLDEGRRLISGSFFCGSNSPYTLDWLWAEKG